MEWLWSALYIVILGIASHFVGEALPRKMFDSGRFPYRAYRFEKNGEVYERLHIRAWKDVVPDMSKYCKRMVRKKAGNKAAPEELSRLIRETCVAESVHWALILLSPGIPLLCPTAFGYALWAFDVLLLNLPFILIQRYNRPRLLLLRKRMCVQRQHKRDRALILTCNTGGGHNATARAVQEAFAAENVMADITDVLSFSPSALNRLISKGHVLLYRLLPKLYGKGYAYAENTEHADREPRKPSRRLFRESELYERILEQGYCAVVCVHVFAANAMTWIRKDYGDCVANVFVATDYTCSPGVAETDVEGYCIPHASLKEEFIAKGIPEGKLYVTGIPVSAGFSDAGDSAAARGTLGIAGSQYVALAMCGSMGCGAVEALARSFQSEPLPDTLPVAICGTNEWLRRRLAEKPCESLRVVGYTNDMETYLRAADAVVTKAGGLSITESVAMRKPLVLLNAVPGVETRNIEFFAQNGFAVVAGDSGEAMTLLDECLRHPEDAAARAQHAWESLPRDAASRIAEIALALAA